MSIAFGRIGKVLNQMRTLRYRDALPNRNSWLFLEQKIVY